MQVVIGVLKNANNEVLIAQRPPGKPQAGAWEFPGGKIAPDETPWQALVREFHEEVGIVIVTAAPWQTFQYAYSNYEVHLHCWAITEFTGLPYGKEGQPITWAHPNQLNKFDFLLGNQKIIAEIQLSNR